MLNINCLNFFCRICRPREERSGNCLALAVKGSHNGQGLDDSILQDKSFLILDRCLQTTSHLHPTSLTNTKPSHPQDVPRIIPATTKFPIMFSTLHCVSLSVSLLLTHVVVFSFAVPCAFACTPFSPASFVSALPSLLFTMRIV